jgi:tripartite-type tricarboxylate transporter receptor subunit TctC
MFESGFAGFFVDNMYGVMATGGTPRAVVRQLNAAIVRAVNVAEIRERLTGQGYDTLGDSPADFADYLRSEVAKWAKVVKESGIRAD